MSARERAIKGLSPDMHKEGRANLTTRMTLPFQHIITTIKMDVIRKRGIDSLDDFALCTHNIILITNYDDNASIPCAFID